MALMMGRRCSGQVSHSRVRVSAAAGNGNGKASSAGLHPRWGQSHSGAWRLECSPVKEG